MNQNIALLSLGDLYAVNVVYKNSAGEYVSKEYTYLSTQKIEPGTEVIVESPYSGMVVVRVASCALSDFDVFAEYEYKFVVQVVDRKAHDKTKNLIRKLKDQMRAAVHRKQHKQILKDLDLDSDSKFMKTLGKLQSMLGGNDGKQS
jgi:hypothetical protein